MNIGKFLLDTVKARIITLKNEISLIDKQLAALSSSPGIKIKNHFQNVLEKNLKFTTYNVYLQYYNSMSQLTLSAYQLQQVVSSHLYAMNLAPLQILLQELYGHKLALDTFLSAKSKCNSTTVVAQFDTHDDYPSIDDSVNFIFTVFPFEISVCLLSNSSFFTFLLKNVLNYDPQRHKKIVYSVFKKIEDFFKSHPLSNKSIYYRYQNPLCYLLAEHFISVFINKPYKHSLRDYSTAEKCAIIAQNGCQICQLNLSLLQKIQNLSSSNQSTDDTDDSSTNLSLSPNISNDSYSYDMASFSSSFSTDQSYSSSSELYFDEEKDEIDVSAIPSLRYSIYEMRKISLQPSPSQMLFVLSKAINSIQMLLLSADGGMVGADETFPFIIYCLSLAKLNRLPSIIEYIEKYADFSLRETKFFYYIQHLKSSLNFIDDQRLEKSPFYIFPFSKPPKHLEKILTRVKESKPVYLKGFTVYAYPLWHSDIPFPALFHYNGGIEKAIGYQYRITDNALFDIPSNMKAIQTVNGTFLQISDEFIDSNSLIKVDGGDYDASIDDIEVVSSMIIMDFTSTSNDKDLIKPSTSMRSEFYEKYIKKFWGMKNVNNGRFETGDIAVKATIAEVQIALVILEKLPSNFIVDGNLNYETIEAIKNMINQNNNQKNRNIKDIIHPKVFYRIVSEMKKKNQT